MHFQGFEIESRPNSLELGLYSLVIGEFNLEFAKTQTSAQRFKMLFVDCKQAIDGSVRDDYAARSTGPRLTLATCHVLRVNVLRRFEGELTLHPPDVIAATISSRVALRNIIDCQAVESDGSK